MSAIANTGAMAACASSNAASTSSRGRARDPGGHGRVELVAMRGAPFEALEPVVGADADELEGPLGHALRRGRDRHPVAVGTLVRAARHGVGDAAPETGLLVREQPVGRDQRPHELEEGLQEVHVDDLAHAGVQRHERGERADQTGDLVGQCDRGKQRPAVVLTVDGGEPAHGLGDGGEPRPSGVRAVLTEAGDARDHETWVPDMEHLRAQAETFERSRPEVLDQHVRTVDEAQQDRPVRLVLEIEGDAALVPALELPPQREAVPGITPAEVAQRVPSSRALDLDYVSAEVGQVPRARRPGHDRRDVEHTEVAQGAAAGVGRPLAHRGPTGKHRSCSAPIANVG